MQDIISFLMANWWLVAGAVVVAILLVANEAYGAAKGPKKCTSAMATRLINQDHAQVIDVRDKVEFKSGHISGSTNIPLANLTDKDPNLDKNHPIIVVCKMGQRAQTGAMALKKQGYQNVLVLTGGITTWRGDGLPLVKK